VRENNTHLLARIRETTGAEKKGRKKLTKNQNSSDQLGRQDCLCHQYYTAIEKGGVQYTASDFLNFILTSTWSYFLGPLKGKK
jgi:hypothetical protein